MDGTCHVKYHIVFKPPRPLTPYHCSYIDQRPEKKAHMDLLPIVKSAVSIPMIANGDVFKYEDIEKVKQITTCSSVLIARGALWNCSVFQPKPIPAIDVALDLFDKVTRSTSARCNDWRLTTIRSLFIGTTAGAIPSTSFSACLWMWALFCLTRSTWPRPSQSSSKLLGIRHRFCIR